MIYDQEMMKKNMNGHFFLFEYMSTTDQKRPVTNKILLGDVILKQVMTVHIRCALFAIVVDNFGSLSQGFNSGEIVKEANKGTQVYQSTRGVRTNYQQTISQPKSILEQTICHNLVLQMW